VTPQLQLAAQRGGGAERAGRVEPARKAGLAPASNPPPAAVRLVDGPADLQAAQAAYDRSLSHALCARTVEQVRERFLIVEQRAVELRVLARRAA
jgi:hypothetical protein